MVCSTTKLPKTCAPKSAPATLPLLLPGWLLTSLSLTTGTVLKSHPPPWPNRIRISPALISVVQLSTTLTANLPLTLRLGTIPVLRSSDTLKASTLAQVSAPLVSSLWVLTLARASPVIHVLFTSRPRLRAPCNTLASLYSSPVFSCLLSGYSNTASGKSLILTLMKTNDHLWLISVTFS